MRGKQSPIPKTEVTLGADKGYGAAEIIEELQRLKVTPHVALSKSSRRSSVRARRDRCGRGATRSRSASECRSSKASAARASLA